MKTNTFTITEDHIKLLNRMYVSWSDCEFGAPDINPKRPYGNSGVISDIAEILGVKSDIKTEYDEEEFSDELYNKLHKKHLEMETVLQIVLYTLSFVPGTYIQKNYRHWELEP